MEDEAFLPPWASAPANGDYTLPKAALPTRDGRAIGNAVNAGPTLSRNPQPTYLVCTDAGTVLKLTEDELRYFFHPPEFIMIDPLTMQQEALAAEKGDPR